MPVRGRGSGEGGMGQGKHLPLSIAVRMPPQVCTALDHPLRRNILRLLRRVEPLRSRSLGELREVMGIESRAEVAFHARKLCECGMLRIVRRERYGGNSIPYYALTITDDASVALALAITEEMDRG